MCDPGCEVSLGFFCSSRTSGEKQFLLAHYVICYCQVSAKHLKNPAEQQSQYNEETGRVHEWKTSSSLTVSEGAWRTARERLLTKTCGDVVRGNGFRLEAAF